MATGDQEPTAWELFRVMESVQATLARMEGRMVTQDALRTYQESNERRFISLEKGQADWTVESRGEHTRLDAKINAQAVDFRAMLDAYRAKQEDLERKAREQEATNAASEKRERSARILSISLAVLAIVGSLVVSVIQTAIGAP